MNRRDFLKGSSLLLLTGLLERELAVVARAPSRFQARSEERAPNVLVIVFDTLAAAHMSLYGYPRQTTPHLERFAANATVYHQHYAGGNFTTSGTATLLTGNYAWRHRAVNHTGTVAPPFRDQNLFSAFGQKPYHRVAYSHNLLANSLLNQFAHHIDEHIHPSTFCLSSGELGDRLFPADADIASRAFEDLILHRGQKIPSSLLLSFADRVRLAVEKRARTQPHLDEFPRGVPELFKTLFVLEDVIDGIGGLVGSTRQPFLGYFHLLPPHEPYRPHRDFIGIFDHGWRPPQKKILYFSQSVPERELERLRRQYDEFLAYADAQFGRLLDHLAQSGRLEDTIVVFTSDHGQLFERGIHGHVTPTLYNPLIHVPLLISLPGQKERYDVYTPTSCIDLIPTLLHLAGQEIPSWCEGEVLAPFSDNAADPERAVFAIEAKSNRKNAPLEKVSLAMVQGRYKLICYKGYEKADDVCELYDLRTDPAELEEQQASKPVVTSEMKRVLNRRLAEVNHLTQLF